MICGGPAWIRTRVSAPLEEILPRYAAAMKRALEAHDFDDVARMLDLLAALGGPQEKISTEIQQVCSGEDEGRPCSDIFPEEQRDPNTPDETDDDTHDEAVPIVRGHLTPVDWIEAHDPDRGCHP